MCIEAKAFMEHLLFLKKYNIKHVQLKQMVEMVNRS